MQKHWSEVDFIWDALAIAREIRDGKHKDPTDAADYICSILEQWLEENGYSEEDDAQWE